MVDIKCKYRLLIPEDAGAFDMDTLKVWAKKYPHMRPCKNREWWWVNRAFCEKCPDAITPEQ